MEVQVGELWHRLITRLADPSFPKAAVTLPEVERTVGLMFRALGGDGGLRVAVAEQIDNKARRRWMQRLAGSQTKLVLAWRDESFLRLPGRIDCLPKRELNRELYLWQAAMAVSASEDENWDWFTTNQRWVQITLNRFPGLEHRYRKLLKAHIEIRPEPQALPKSEAAAERAIRAALREPGSVTILPVARRAPATVPLWLHPQPPLSVRQCERDDPDDAETGWPDRPYEIDGLRRHAERVRAPNPDRGLVALRMENIFSWGEFVNVDRGTEDEDDLSRAETIAGDLDRLSVSRNARRTAGRVKLDLDLPAEAEDDAVIGEGKLLPEWDWKRQRLVPDHCRIVPMQAVDVYLDSLPQRLQRTARRLRHQFQTLAPARVWCRRQLDGQEIDLEAYLRFTADLRAGYASASDGLYRQVRSGTRDLSCLLMADLSLSTDTWVNDHDRVIDVVRDSLFLFAEALDATGDRFGMYGFSSRRRDPVRVHTLKTFDEHYGGTIRGRIQAIQPGYYTRMGAAIRYGTTLLAQQPSGRRLLLVVTDGKPNDLDQYEGRYGIEDTRQAVVEARRQGLQPFCVTIDSRANDYLPYLFGSGGYVVIRRSSDLPKRLPMLYAQLTA